MSSFKTALYLVALTTIGCTVTVTPFGQPVAERGAQPLSPPFAQVEGIVKGNRPAAGSEIQGLQVTRGDTTLTAAAGMVLQKGDRIVTDNATEAVLVFEDAYEVILSPDTAITISPDFFVDFGKAVVKKLKEIRKKFQAETKYVNAGVEHTEFAISVDRGDVVSVVVQEGTVTLESTEKTWPTQTISARQGAVVRAAQPPTRRERVPQGELDRTFDWARRVEGVVFPAEVPDLVGRSLGEARDELSSIGLRVGSIRKVAGRPDGTVLRQSRPAGQRVRLGTVVDLEVAAEVSVPNVTGMSQIEAMAALGFVGLNVGETSEEEDTGGRPGRVARQYPPPGTRVPPGTPVSLVIAARRPPPQPPPDDRGDWGERHERPEHVCTVPDIRSVTVERASSALRKYNLRLGNVQRLEGRRAFVTQNPEPGTQVQCGSSVDLVIYSEPSGTRDAAPETLCTVPDLRQVPVERASALLRKYNLQLGRVQRVEGRSAGVAQNPEPGTQVHCGSSVDLVIYSGPSGTHDGPVVDTPPACTVPDLSQVPVESAATVLRRYNLELGKVQRIAGAKSVVAQNPQPGTRVPCGSSVDLVIHYVRSGPSGTYDGPLVVQPTTCTVPDVRGLNAEGARRTLKAHGLVLGEFQVGGDERRQSPEPNTTVRCGTTVNVYAVIR
jgi:beta-lactam-binding protein with PASTA domain